jgi:hypothetical protein
MLFAMMRPAERDREFVADLLPKPLSQDPSVSWDDLAGNLVASIWFALTDLAP